MNNEEENEKKKKIDLDKFKAMTSTPRGKAILFFAVYFVFFLVLGIISRVDLRNNDNVKYESGTQRRFSYTSIESNNYNFNYNIIIDGNNTSYVGRRTGLKEKFKVSTNDEFYSENNLYFKNNNGVWLKNDNPYIYKEFYDLNNIKKLIDNSTYISKTSYESGQNVYNFAISTATILKNFENLDIDISEVPNEIIVISDKNNLVSSIKYNLDSYCKYKQLCVNNMSIELVYDEYGNVQEITSPLN